jgi:asparagine synthase (glutamine-hydrolysing)
VSGVCGFASDGRGEPPQRTIDAMAAALVHHGPETTRVVQGTRGALASATLGDSCDLYHAEGLLAVVFGYARLLDRADAGLLEHPAQWVAEAYRRDGPQCLSALGGAFALAVVSERGGTSDVLIAVDRSASKPLAFGMFQRTFAFASSLRALRAHPLVPSDIRMQAIYDYLYFHVVPGPETVLRGCRHLLPGQYATCRDGSVSVGRYWEPVFVEDDRRRFEELRDRFVDLLKSSVEPFATRDDVGCFLSGGTDSSTVSGMLTKTSGRPARTYSIGFDVRDYDEMEFARIAARHFGTDHHEYYVTPDDVVSAVPKVAAFYDQPFGNASVVPAFYCARRATQDGVKLMLAGDGGDELFGGNSRYATQRVFSWYTDLPPALRRGVIEPLLRVTPSTLAITRKARSYVAQACTPMPARMQTYNLLNRIGVDAILTPEFLAEIDREQPLRMQQDTYSRARAESLINRMLAFDLKFTLADSDLPKVNGACEMAGVQVAYPLLDDRIVDFSTRLVPEYKLKGTTLRWFFKEALRGFLPAETIAKKKHGFGLPFGRWLESHEPLRDMAHESLGRLARLRWIRPDFIERLTGEHMASHAGYYGTMVWVLVMLEQWIEQSDTGTSVTSPEPRPAAAVHSNAARQGSV